MKFLRIILFILLVGLVLLPNRVGAEPLPMSDSLTSSYVYRFWSDVFKGHFFTSSYYEATNVKDNDTNWKYEQVAYSAFRTEQPNSVPVYRFWSPVFHGHFYTISQEEMTRVRDTDSNWDYEKVDFYVYPLSYEGDVTTVYRFWSPVFLHHFYTADSEEMMRVKDTDTNWEYEGPAFKVPVEGTEQGQVTEQANETTKAELGEDAVLEDVTVRAEEAINRTENDNYTPDSDNRLIAVEVFLKNTGTDPLSYSPSDFVLKDPTTGKIYYYSVPAQSSEFAGGTLQPGEEASGYVTFELPKELQDLILLYQSDKMAENNNAVEVDFEFKPTVEIISHEVVNDPFSGEQIVGKVINNSDSKVKLVKVYATFYDVYNQVVSTNFSYAEGSEDYLENGEKADFKIWYDTNQDVEYYKLDVTWKVY